MPDRDRPGPAGRRRRRRRDDQELQRLWRVVAQLVRRGTRLGRSFTGGQELSGGQWQRLALARGMMTGQVAMPNKLRLRLTLVSRGDARFIRIQPICPPGKTWSMPHRTSKNRYNVTSTRQPRRPVQGRKPRNGQNTRHPQADGPTIGHSTTSQHRDTRPELALFRNTHRTGLMELWPVARRAAGRICEANVVCWGIRWRTCWRRCNSAGYSCLPTTARQHRPRPCRHAGKQVQI
jgi:hypothetical protein